MPPRKEEPPYLIEETSKAVRMMIFTCIVYRASFTLSKAKKYLVDNNLAVSEKEATAFLDILLNKSVIKKDKTKLVVSRETAKKVYEVVIEVGKQYDKLVKLFEKNCGETFDA